MAKTPKEPDVRVYMSADTIPPTAVKFYEAVGRAITDWQRVEQSLCDIFVNFSTCNNEKIARAIFYTPRDFEVKLTMTRNAARLFFSRKTDASELWDELRGRCAQEMKTRNALAHFHVVFAVSKDTTLKSRLTPNWDDPNIPFIDSRDKQKPPMDIDDVWSAAIRFKTLSSDLQKFAQKIDQQSTMPEESA